MKTNKIALWLALLAFTTLTVIAVSQHGYWGFFDEAFSSWATRLLAADLVICLVLVSLWMWQDAQRRGRNVWPFLALATLFGAAGPLLYLITNRGGKAVPHPGTTSGGL